jgi:sn1-specific diacylglycerol lipase
MFLLRSPVPRLPLKNWQIVVTGHSLGAGAAAFVLLWLKMAFPQAVSRAWLYGCPAGIMSAEAAEVLAPWCTQVVLGKDLVARLSMESFHQLRDTMVTARCGPFAAH